MAKPLYSCMTKATTAEGEALKYGPNWLLAKRGTLKVYEDKLLCGSWEIGYEKIQEAVLYSIKQNIVIPGYVLKIVTEERTYHFGLNSNKFWRGKLPFSAKREKGKLGYTKFSFFLRLGIFVALIYFLLERLGLLDGLW